jgi:hypothetical protein
MEGAECFNQITVIYIGISRVMKDKKISSRRLMDGENGL